MTEHVPDVDRGTDPGSPPEPALQVVATAGHVDHGKSSLILRLTGIDPDRLAEEKRRGLTIDLGFAWFTLPSGHEIGFVDVPGHERFIRNMLAGVGPVRLVLFVVAADEGWKPLSEEHLEIVDVLGADGAVVALTKRDLVEPDTLDRRIEEVRRKLHGTRLADSPIVPCSAATGEGIDDVRKALDDLIASAPPPETGGRPRQHLDRVFTIRGSGTVVTGTLTGGPLTVGQEAEVLPSGNRARIRGLQSHKRVLQSAVPVSRVAVNLVGTSRQSLERGDVLVLPGQWRPTTVFDVLVRSVRGLTHPLTSRGAYKLHAGSAERDVRIKFLSDSKQLRPGEESFARITARRPLVLDFRDRFVLREAGRQETVAGGLVLDIEPPGGWNPNHAAMLEARNRTSDRGTVAEVLVRERRFVRASDVYLLTGARADEVSAAVRVGPWVTLPAALDRTAGALTQALGRFHVQHPLRAGMDVADARAVLAGFDRVLDDSGLADDLLTHLAELGTVIRSATVVHLPEHLASTAGREDADRLVETIRSAEPQPPTIKELLAAGFARELVEAACADGRLVRVSGDLVVTPELIAQAEAVVRANGAPPGITVSGFRQAMGTSRKYALPLLEYFDAHGLTRRQGDARLVRN
jgi:selenocysteine-specific elongation factor